MYGEARFSSKVFTDGPNCLLKVQLIRKLKKDRTPNMEDCVNPLILTERRLTIENITEQLGTSWGTAYKIDDLSFSKVSCWFPKIVDS